MLFGDLKFPMRWVYAFNTDLTCLYRSEADMDDQEAMGVLLDASGSMERKQNEVKLILSALKCMTNTMGCFNAPAPAGPTAIVDSVNSLGADDMDMIKGVKKLVVITDGEDNASVVERVIKCFTDAGDPELVDLPKWPETGKVQKWAEFHREGERYTKAQYLALPVETRDALRSEHSAWFNGRKEARASAVAAHLDALNIDMFVVGLGAEVKTFISECAKPGRGLRTAHINTGSNAEDVGAVMTSVVRRKRRAL